MRQIYLVFLSLVLLCFLFSAGCVSSPVKGSETIYKELGPDYVYTKVVFQGELSQDLKDQSTLRAWTSDCAGTLVKAYKTSFEEFKNMSTKGIFEETVTPQQEQAFDRLMALMSQKAHCTLKEEGAEWVLTTEYTLSFEELKNALNTCYEAAGKGNEYFCEGDNGIFGYYNQVQTSGSNVVYLLPMPLSFNSTSIKIKVNGILKNATSSYTNENGYLVYDSEKVPGDAIVISYSTEGAKSGIATPMTGSGTNGGAGSSMDNLFLIAAAIVGILAIAAVIWFLRKRK